MAIADGIKDIMSGSSWIRRMFEAGAEMKKRYGADKVFDLSIGNPNMEPPTAFKEALINIAKENFPLKHGYMPNAGYSDVRRSVAEYVSHEYGAPLNEQNIIMTCGTGGALNVILKTILNPNDTVICSLPCFPEYHFYVSNHGGKIVSVSKKESFDLDVEEIERAITRKTAAVLINSPNNPTGKVYPESTIKELGNMLERKSREMARAIYLVSDEPYRKIVFDGITVPSIFKHYRNSIVATSYSKDLSLAGERIGWIAVHPDAEDSSDLVNGMILCNRILGFVNAPALMQRVIGRIQGQSVDVMIYKRKRDLLCSAFSEMGYRFEKPEGTFYLFPKAPGGDDIKFVERLQKELILAVPGRGFGLEGYFRVAFCTDDKVIEGSLRGFKQAIEDYG